MDPSSSSSPPHSTSLPSSLLSLANTSSSTRYLTLSHPHLLPPGDTSSYLLSALEDIIANYPPRSRYPHEILQGLWSGPTGMGYLLLQVSSHLPDLTISGQPAIHWARGYMSASRGHNLRLGSHGCGISDERLAFEAVRAAVTKEMQHVREFVNSVGQVMTVAEYPDENLFGRAGTLYLLRLVRHWVPGSERAVGPAITEISNMILGNGGATGTGEGREGKGGWKWHGKRYLGAVHGDIGILTQLVLTSPELANKVEPMVSRLLEMQMADGNWPSVEGQTHGGQGALVQFCHGAPGMVVSLLSLRECFPELRERIDVAVERGRECIWSQGLLKKEPNLCHGIFGNALALPLGQLRDHFLGIAAPENMSYMKKSDPTGKVFERADYGRSYSTLSSYTPCAVWTWLVCREEAPGILAYNDI